MDKGLIDYFIQETNKKFDKVEADMRSIDSKVDQLLEFKWQIIGGSVILSLVVTLIIQLGTMYLAKKERDDGKEIRYEKHF